MEINLIQSVSIMILVSIIIIIYHILIIRNDVSSDNLNQKIFTIGNDCCSYWPITHFILYLILGTISKIENYFYIIVLSIIWEYTEELFGILNNPKYINIPYLFNKNIKDPDISKYEYKQFWEGSKKDIIFNILGLFVGYFIKSYLV